MSSESAEIQKQKSGGFIFTWSIHNFSHYYPTYDCILEGPEFRVKSLGDAFFRLQTRPAYFRSGIINCSLVNIEKYSNCLFSISIYKKDGTLEGIACNGNHISKLRQESHGIKSGSTNSLKYYFDNDSLTFQCRMWKKDEYNQPLVHCRAHTDVKVSKINYTWTLDDIVDNEINFTYKFNHSTEVPARISSTPSIKIYTTNGGSYGEDAIYFGVQVPELKEDLFLVCVIHFLDPQKRVTHTVSKERFLKVPGISEVWYFRLISKDELYSNKKLYLDNDQLVLQCAFSFSEKDVMHKIEYGTPDELQKQTACSSMSKGHEIWNGTLGTFYSEGKQSNVILRIPGREFPVHRDFLSAHSEVFCAMFGHNMKEQNSGVIEIDDMEDDIVDKMLKFVYTGTVEGMDHSVAQKLYYAADKYRIESLLEICSNTLRNGINLSNVCDVLILADRHHDEKLKLHATDFLSNHMKEIVVSENWKNMKVANAQLFYETMEWLFNNKL